jgi:hypothetical protein
LSAPASYAVVVGLSISWTAGPTRMSLRESGPTTRGQAFAPGPLPDLPRKNRGRRAASGAGDAPTGQAQGGVVRGHVVLSRCGKDLSELGPDAFDVGGRLLVRALVEFAPDGIDDPARADDVIGCPQDSRAASSPATASSSSWLLAGPAIAAHASRGMRSCVSTPPNAAGTRTSTAAVSTSSARHGLRGRSGGGTAGVLSCVKRAGVHHG